MEYTTSISDPDAVRADNTYVTMDEVTIILGSEASLAGSDQARAVIEMLKDLLPALVQNGELQISETGLRRLARGTVAEMAKQPLTRNVITSRQFEVSYQKTHTIADSNNRITWNVHHCDANYGIRFTLNSEQHCLFGVGGSVEFVEQGVTYQLVFEGYGEGDPQMALFGIYPSAQN